MKNNKEELIAGFKRLRPLELIEIAQAMGFESVFHDIIISDYTWEIGFNAETNSFVAVCSELSCSTFGESMEELEQNIKLMIEHSQKVMEDGISYIVNERIKQKLTGYNDAHDEKYTNNELIKAAMCYLEVADTANIRDDAAHYHRFANSTKIYWPWTAKHWHPSNDVIENLQKAGALIAAEIDRVLLDRKKQKKMQKTVDESDLRAIIANYDEL